MKWVIKRRLLILKFYIARDTLAAGVLQIIKDTADEVIENRTKVCEQLITGLKAGTYTFQNVRGNYEAAEKVLKYFSAASVNTSISISPTRSKSVEDRKSVV